MAGGEPMAAGRTKAVCRTIYQPSRRHIDFSVLRLAPMWLITQSSWPTGVPPSQHSLAQFLLDGFCPHCESLGCTTRKGTAHRQHGRLPAHSSERRFVSQWLSAERGQSYCTPVRHRTWSNGGGTENHVERRKLMPADVELIELCPLDGATRVLVYHYVAWCYALNARRPATMCRVAPGWTVLVGWQ
jgi:hypothetical protein